MQDFLRAAKRINNIQIKGDLDALERTKDEESKKFQSHNIDFDFHILVQIKESMVDVSSSCMELALKVDSPFSSAFEYIQERRQTKTAETAVSGTKTEPRSAGAKMLWRAFQFAFRVYSFAGGHDDRADMIYVSLNLDDDLFRVIILLYTQS